MPEQTTSIDYVMEAASGPHFSGLRLDDRFLSSSSSALADSIKQPFVIGVSGGTASGKTTVCDMIIQQLHDHRVVLVNQICYAMWACGLCGQSEVRDFGDWGLAKEWGDSFYRGLSAEESERVHEYNFDHPGNVLINVDAFDTEQMLECVEKLKQGNSVQLPIYDFKNHRRCSESFRQVNASDVIILEGILVFHDQRVRDLMNMKIFVDTDADVRLARRIRRDTVERGRDVNSVLEQALQEEYLTSSFISVQYAKFVKPAFDDFVLPSKKYADVIIPRGGDNHVAIDLIVQHIRTKLGQHDLCKIYPNIYVIQSTFQIRGMHTLIRDKEISKHDFVFYSDRLIRLVVEHGLGHLPFTEMQVVTPTGSVYSGVDFCKKLCGVSIVRSGESMENALRACCKGIKIGKILIHRDGDNGKQLIYEKLPKDISERHVLLLDPVLATGNSANQSIELLIQKGVPESYIIFLNLISAPEGIHCVSKRFPAVKIVTSEIDVTLNDEYRVIPGLGPSTSCDGRSIILYPLRCFTDTLVSRCSGCTHEHNLHRPIVLQEATTFFKKHGVSDFTFDTCRLWGWRCRAKLAIRGSSADPQIGLYEEGTHNVVDIPDCKGRGIANITSYPRNIPSSKHKCCRGALEKRSYIFNAILFLERMAVTTYNTSLPASERYRSGRVQVSLVWNARSETSASAEKLNDLATVIFGNRWRHILGERDFWEHVGGIDVYLAPSSFGQANTKFLIFYNGFLISTVHSIDGIVFILQAFDSLLQKLHKYVPLGASVTDLYAGAGVIGLSVRCVEINKESKLAFEKTIERLPSSLDSSISWHHADTSLDPLSWLVGSDVLVVDPPRKGLDPALIGALRAIKQAERKAMTLESPTVNVKDEKRPWILRAREDSVNIPSRTIQEESRSLPQTLIYISCGWESFKENCTALLSSKAWHLSKAHGFNFFPGTQSIEILAVFKRGTGASVKKKKSGKKKKKIKSKIQ
ncbi:uridine kinase-like 2 [Artemisia annua]|uniref:uridine/cytidine kinase n=2 Tax=Anthemideae TaxID=102810 RepID=A0A2U1N1V8_ARTAN|nr:uridine kinase-like 2 [Artemisia annua]